ncbi:hypothetical protein [Hippea jasoniae]|uniref:hypothetical protein n=1 Tax=Hippea jasoniae TaxID=944479 RepID=UPI000B0EAD55|nr:hypothetical protein [Hippea jasoniae]
MKLSEFCKLKNIKTTICIKKLKQANINATAEATLKELAAQKNSKPIDIVNLLIKN